MGCMIAFGVVIVLVIVALVVSALRGEWGWVLLDLIMLPLLVLQMAIERRRRY